MATILVLDVYSGFPFHVVDDLVYDLILWQRIALERDRQKKDAGQLWQCFRG